MPLAYSTKNEVAIDRQGSLTFTVARTGTSSELAQPSQVAFETADNTATAGSDYVPTSGQLSFAADVVEQTVVVDILDAAYDKSSAIEFQFRLQNFASATGIIEPATRSSALQSYFVVPESGVVATVPTTSLIDDDTTKGKSAEQAEKSGAPTYQTIRYQTDYENLGDGVGTTTDQPFAYLRFGFARQDMNDYERVVANAPAFHPDWLDWDDAGQPNEIGPLSGRMVPRGISRQSDPKEYQKTVDELKKSNANLDGLLLYSGSNYSVTVGRHLNRVVQGDNSNNVGGFHAQVVDKGRSVWTYFDDALQLATGLDKVNGQIWQYDISDAQKLKISAQPRVRYALDTHLGVYSLARGEVRNDVRYSITNGISQHTQGMAAFINSDILGNYALNLPGTTHVSNGKSYLAMADLPGLYITCNPELSWGATAAVAISSAAVAAFGAGMTTAAGLSRFQSAQSFYKNANSENLGSDYADTFSTALPDTMAALAAVNTAIVIAATAMQVMTTWWPSESPVISANTTTGGMAAIDVELNWRQESSAYGGDALANIEMQTGASKILINDLGVTMNAPLVEIRCGSFDIDGPLLEPVASSNLMAGGVLTVNAGTGGISMTGENTTVSPLMEIAGNVLASGALTANLVQL